MSSRPERPPFCPGVAAIDERLVQVKPAQLEQLGCQPMHHSLEHSFALPLLKPSMAGRWRRVPPGDLTPRCPCPQHPQDPIEHRSRVRPRASATRRPRPTLLDRDEPSDPSPLLVAHFHPRGQTQPRQDGNHPRKTKQSRSVAAACPCGGAEHEHEHEHRCAEHEERIPLCGMSSSQSPSGSPRRGP